MAETAHKKKHVLITQVSSFLGSALAKSLLGQNCVVWGISAKHLSADLLASHDFTLLDIDLAQPLPHYLPKFDFVFHLPPQSSQRALLPQTEISPATKTLTYLAKTNQSKVFVFAPLTANSDDFYDYLIGSGDDLAKYVKLLLVGDLYGPDMPAHEDNELAKLIFQAVNTDKIIVGEEGLMPIYPAYISDVIFAIAKIAFAGSDKNIYFLVSEEAKTSLSASYEIQNATSRITGKEIGLFFSGPKVQTNPQPIIVIRTDSLGYIPKVKLVQGLADTLEYFVAKGQVAQIKTVPRASQIAKGLHQQTQSNISPPAKLMAIPRLSFNFRLKNILLLLLAIILISLAKTGLDLFIGTQNLKNAKSALLKSDFKSARQMAQSSQKSFLAARNKVRIFTSPVAFILSDRVEAIHQILDGLVQGAGSLTYFVEGSEALNNGLIQITSQKALGQEGFNQDITSANFQKAFQLSSQASHQLKTAPEIFLIKDKIAVAGESFLTVAQAAKSAYELVSLLDNLVGGGSPKTYLVLLQNNTELRPGGGFIGNFATLEFDAGMLKNIAVEDIYTIDGQLQEKIEPPRQLKEKLNLDRFYLRDSNWSGDFAVNSATARDFFKKETGKDVAGVIAMDLTFIQNLLAATGPINLNDYNEQITADNLFERGEYHSEIGFFPGSTQKRDFFGALTRALMDRIVESVASFKSDSSLPALVLVDLIQNAFSQKHLMVTFDDPNLASYIATHGWDQPLPPRSFNPADDSGKTRDFLALSEANLGANKVNRFLDRAVSYEMTIGRDADLVAKLTITYTNESQAGTWPGGKYVNFLRVYVPFAAGILEYQNGENTSLNEVEITFQDNLTVFATYVEVPIKSTRVVTLTYRIPKNIKLETAPTYHLYVSKQPGTDRDPFTFTFNLPQYLEVKSVASSSCHPEPIRSEPHGRRLGSGSDECVTAAGNQNLAIKTDLATDRQFEIEVAKK